VIEKPSSCRDCPLYGKGLGFSSPSGHLNHGVMLVGEALGEEEEEAGLPFQGKAGKLLDRLIQRTTNPLTGLKFKREDFLVSNCVQCRPPDNVLTDAPYEEEALAKCKHFLEAQISYHKPKVILAMGNQALRALTGNWGIDQLRGYYFDTPYGIVIGSYHPSYISRGNFEVARVFQLDLVKAVQTAKNGKHERKRGYVLSPSGSDLRDLYEALRAEPTLPIAFDIETPYGDVGGEEKDDEFLAIEDDSSYSILRISFSHKEGWAISMPWMEPYVSWAKKILALPNPKVSWNGTGFDIPRLVANGVTLGGDHFDAMLMWHALEPSLPMGLKYVGTFFCPDMPPWKLQSRERPEWYNAADSDVTICCYNGIRAGLESQGRWQMFLTHFVEVDKILRRMSGRGICVDRLKRKENRERFQKRYDETVEKMQPLVPEEIKRTKPYTWSEEKLREKGVWVEGGMVVVKAPLKKLHGTQEIKDGWVVRKPKPPKKVRVKKNEKSIRPEPGVTLPSGDAKRKVGRPRKKGEEVGSSSTRG
jgi:uracil-DNA glycosylase family 4